MQPPTACGFQALEAPAETPRRPHQWSLGGAGGQPGTRTGDHVGCSNKCFKHVLSP